MADNLHGRSHSRRQQVTGLTPSCRRALALLPSAGHFHVGRPNTRARASASYEVRVPGQVVYPGSNSVRANATFNTIRPLWASDPAVLVPPSVTATFAPRPGSCTLPAGVTSSATGAIDGHPTQTGAFQCTFTVTYAANGANWTGEAVLNLDVR